MGTGNERILGLKVDVDTYVGMKKGVPRLLRTLKDFGVKATFFLSFGPDSSGRAVVQLVKNPLFLKKMLRTGAGRLYGWKTALYGTVLPSPMTALSFPTLSVRSCRKAMKWSSTPGTTGDGRTSSRSAATPG